MLGERISLNHNSGKAHRPGCYAMRPSRCLTVSIALCACVLMSCFGARTGLDTQDRRVPRCADSSMDILVTVQPAPGLSASSPITRVTWWFQVACNPTPPPYRTSYYNLSVRQEAGQAPEPINGTFEILPASAPFSFILRGPATGYWCTTAEVEFADGVIRRAGPSLNIASPAQNLAIGVLTSRQHGENQAAPVRLRDPSICFEAPRG
jgi:hypothetical protein